MRYLLGMTIVAAAFSALVLTGCTDQPQPGRVAWSNAKFPILDARGKWTVRFLFYGQQRGEAAVDIANRTALALRRKGLEAYVADLNETAWVTIGSFPGDTDPMLLQTWRQCYDEWKRFHGGHESEFSRQMREWHGDPGAPAGGFGDEPWPVRILALQAEMKYSYGKIDGDEHTKILIQINKEREAARAQKREATKTDSDRN
jgi:hypothetical protein